MTGEVNHIGLVIKQSWREKIRAQARELRRNETPSERLLWKILRNRKYPVIHYVSKRPYYFIADFYCHESKLVLEIDGNIHTNQKDYDTQRSLILKELGITVLRITNEELSDLQDIIKKIKKYL